MPNTHNNNDKKGSKRKDKTSQLTKKNQKKNQVQDKKKPEKTKKIFPTLFSKIRNAKIPTKIVILLTSVIVIILCAFGITLAANPSLREDIGHAFRGETVKEITENEEISFSTKEEQDNNISEGTRKTKQEGKNGEKIVNYRVVVDRDGNEVSREKINEEISIEPIEEIVVVGTKPKEEYENNKEKYIDGTRLLLKNILNENLAKYSMAGIDWESDAGNFASVKLDQYLKNTPIYEWNMLDAMLVAYNAYNYQNMRIDMVHYTGTSDFNYLKGGGEFDINNEDLCSKLAQTIWYGQLLGPYYDYGEKDSMDEKKLVKDYLATGGARKMTNDQAKAIINKYQNIEDNDALKYKQLSEKMVEYDMTFWGTDYFDQEAFN